MKLLGFIFRYLVTKKKKSDIPYSLKLLGLQPLNPKDLEPKLAAINANELTLKKFGS